MASASWHQPCGTSFLLPTVLASASRHQLLCSLAVYASAVLAAAFVVKSFTLLQSRHWPTPASSSWHQPHGISVLLSAVMASVFGTSFFTLFQSRHRPLEISLYFVSRLGIRLLASALGFDSLARLQSQHRLSRHPPLGVSSLISAVLASALASASWHQPCSLSACCLGINLLASAASVSAVLESAFGMNSFARCSLGISCLGTSLLACASWHQPL